MKGKILITGVNGFLGSHIAKMLLERGYSLRGTVRDKLNKDKLASLENLPFSQNLELYEADLLNPTSIDNAIQGCDYIMHVAAPVVMVGEESQIVKPAVEGTRSVLEAAIKHKVKGIIMTSSMLTIINLESKKEVFDEEDWPNVENVHAPYAKAKILSEKLAWEIYNKTPKESRPSLTMIVPGYILGPTMTKLPFHSGNFVRDLMNGKLENVPKILFDIVDVRDVALAHVRALEKPETNGQRYACFSGEYLWVDELAKLLEEEFGKYGYKISTKLQEKCLDTDPGSFMSTRWGKSFKINNAKIRKELGIEFIGAKKAAIDMAYSMIKQGLVPNLLPK